VIVGPWEIKLGGGGEHYLADLKRRARDADIVFRGPVFDPLALEGEYRIARLFVYPSLAERGETFGLAPLEAMAHGCAVLVSNLACFQDFVHDGSTGFIFNHRADRPDEILRDKITEIIADPAQLARVAEAGYCQATMDYSLASVATRFLDDFASLLQHCDAATRTR
jgi:glycosyltransferase involved in cell wall biosynthesis